MDIKVTLFLPFLSSPPFRIPLHSEVGDGSRVLVCG